MKRLLVIYFLLLNFSALALDINKNDFFIEQRGHFKYPAFDTDLVEQDFYRKLNHNKRITTHLGKIKFYIINGNLEKAKMMLLQDQTPDKYAQIIKFRYLSIIYFIQGNYERSLEYLSKKEMKTLSYTKNLCLLRSLNLLILDKASDASKQWGRCIDATLDQSSTDHIWMSTLVNLKLRKNKDATKIPFKSINIENEKGAYLKLFLKLSLYLGQQNKILKRLKFLNEDVYTDPEIRELVGMLYYREGELVKSYHFIEDLKSPNSQNIKGNIFLAQKKYELAYAQFKLALKRKINSQNSLERMIPLAWILQQWDDGIDYLEQLDTKEKDKFTKLTIKAALKTQKKDFTGATKDLNKIIYGSRNAQSSEVNQLMTYNSLMLKNKDTAETFADLSCKNNDGINCWLQFHLQSWENFTMTIHRDEKVHQEKVDIINEYTQNFESSPLEEEIFVSQRDIEELDNNLIQLVNEEK